MTQPSGRVICAHCGAQNFDTMPACWQCSAPLRRGENAPVPPMPNAIGYEKSSARADFAALIAPSAQHGDPKVAKRAALALALVFPWFGLPVGWAFMMIEDRRKQNIGRYCAQWSALALVAHLLMIWMTATIMGSMVTNIMPNLNMEKQIMDKMESLKRGGGVNGDGTGGNGLGGGSP